MSQSSQQQILSERSPNTTSPTKSTTTDFKKPVMENKQDSVSQSHNQTYISPSDALQSPTTKKLSDLKAKKIAGGGKPGKSLFKGIVGRREMKDQQEQSKGLGQ